MQLDSLAACINSTHKENTRHLTLKAVLFVHHDNSMGRPVSVRTKHIPVDRDITMADIEKMKHDFADDFFKYNKSLAQADINIVASIPYI